MTDGREPRVQKLSPGEIERLRQEMRQSIEWARTELAHRRIMKLWFAKNRRQGTVSV